MKMMKKGDLALSTIISAVLVLVVLLVVVLIFSGKMGGVSNTISHCDGKCFETDSLNSSEYNRWVVGDPGCKRVSEEQPYCYKYKLDLLP